MLLIPLLAAALLADPAAVPGPTVLVVIGADGTPEYGQQFTEWAARWEQATAAAHGEFQLLGRTTTAETPDDRTQLQQALLAAQSVSDRELWVVLIGHGTFDGKTARFNLRGPDLTATDLATWLQPLTRPLAVINCSSSSGPFLPALSAPGRVVITATRSGHEQNFSRFGDHLSQAIVDPAADLDKDGQTSLFEGYLRAVRETLAFYETEARLTTEHALLDDDGDLRGTPADWFVGLLPVRKPQGTALTDGPRAHQFHLVRSAEELKLSPEQRARRDALELAVVRLREQKSRMEEEAYYARLEQLLLELARISLEPETSPGR